MEEKVKDKANHDTLLKLECDCAIVFFNTHEAQTMKKWGIAPSKTWCLGRVYRKGQKVGNSTGGWNREIPWTCLIILAF